MHKSEFPILPTFLACSSNNLLIHGCDTPIDVTSSRVCRRIHKRIYYMSIPQLQLSLQRVLAACKCLDRHDKTTLSIWPYMLNKDSFRTASCQVTSQDTNVLICLSFTPLRVLRFSIDQLVFFSICHLILCSCHLRHIIISRYRRSSFYHIPITAFCQQ